MDKAQRQVGNAYPIAGSTRKAPKRAREEEEEIDATDIDFTAVDLSIAANATRVAKNRHLALECITQLNLHIQDLEARIRELERNATGN